MAFIMPQPTMPATHPTGGSVRSAPAEPAVAGRSAPHSTSGPGPSRPPIPLIGRFEPGDEAVWLDALRRAMPGESVIGSDQALASDPGAVTVAIVANPDPAVVRRFERLQWVQSLWAGVERLLAEPAFERLPIVRMVDPELARAMAESVLAWTLYLHREMPAYLERQRARQWRPVPYRPPSARRIGLLGLGELGQRAARSLLAAGFPVAGWSRTPKSIEGVTCRHGADGLADLVRTTDILVALLPLTPRTRHLVDARLLAGLPAGASLINFGRGGLVATDDLLGALDSGHLRHAVLDVFEQEPLPAWSPLWAHRSVTVLPHISADSDPVTASAIAARNIARWRETGAIPSPVDRNRGY